MTAKTKLILSIAILFTIVIFSISTIGFINFKSSSVENYSNQLNNQAFLISKTVEQNIDRYFTLLNMVAEQLPIDRDGNIDEEKTIEEVTRIKATLKVLNSYIGTKNGQTYSANKQGIIPNFNAKELKREWYTRVFAGEKAIITTPYTSASGNLVMALGVPVIRAGKVVAVLCVNIPVDRITQLIKGLSTENQVYATRSDGFILASKYPENIGNNLFSIIPSFKQHKTTVTTGHNYEFEGTEYFVASAQIDALGWKIWAWDSQERINLSSNENLMYTSMLAFSLLVISLTIIYFIVIKLMYIPIGGEPKDIEKLLNAISQGNLACAPAATNKDTGVYAEILKMTNNLRSIVESINTSAEHVNVSSEKLSVSTQEVNNSSSDQMMRLEQAATAMHEMTITVDEVARNAVEASAAADQTNEDAMQGTHIVHAMDDNIDLLLGSIGKVVSVTDKLKKETEGIGSILDVIDSISEQTNLLALNAAIEAARAGEHGRGFAVVADEVRNLATKTKESTNEIQTMIQRLQLESNNSVELMNVIVDDAENTKGKSSEASQALTSIQNSITVIQDMNCQIATAAEQQTHVASEINESVVAINDLAKSTHETSSNNKDVAGHLNSVSLSLKESVVTFKI